MENKKRQIHCIKFKNKMIKEKKNKFVPDSQDNDDAIDQLRKSNDIIENVEHGEKDKDFSIKLEDQVLITETGFENLTNYPFADDRRSDVT